MNKGYSVKQADASGRVWNILDASGGQVGACSSREEALRIAALANSGLNKQHAPLHETPPVVEDATKEINQPTAPRPQIFEWYTPSQSWAAWSFLRKLLRLGARRDARSVVSL